MRKSIICALLCYCYICLTAQNYTSYFIGNLTDATTNPLGGVCLMGGATEDDGAMRWFIERASNGDVLVIRASGSNGYNDYLFNEIGNGNLNSVETIVFNNADAAHEPYVLERIAQAEAIWIAGGDQFNYVSYWRDSPVATLINEAISQRNIVIGGTSAGMAILGGAYFSAENGTVTSDAALMDPYNNRMTISNQNFLNVPYLERVITDTHYDDPDRRGRHVAFLARAISDYGVAYQGIACDEYTAVCIDETGMAKVFGTYPDYDDNAYFLTVNCGIADNFPENCSPGSPLSWNQGNAAIKTYAVKGTPTGLYTFDLNTWETGSGGDWENWFVQNGNFDLFESDAPDCSLVATKSPFGNTPSLSVYPNPTQGNALRIETSSNLSSEVSLYDSNGMLIRKWKNVYVSTDLELNNMPTGVYMLEYLNAETRQVRRVVVR
jgi:cyanophycinase-like exopeptidase